ncbi:ATP-binding cassette domain-containing protein [Granulicella paludicola]|uniref:ATP-binding cassette domain-containing protein n=1 Tax=Granulicella paludicola TaxID=474951 RepID=UPI0021DF7AB1|nr:ATP-binding cassette domain-containing protein [Granulicella paludicola]
MADVHHQLRVAGSRGAVRLEVALELSAPWTVLFGPSGSGKSSVLRAACGLLPELDVSFQRSEGDGWVDLTKTPVHRRKIAYAPQGAAVFTHLSVQENVGFAAASNTAVDAALALFVLGAMRTRSVRGISGGEKQRVSLARAFAVPNARLLLLDEPFTGVDRRMRDDLLLRMQERAEAEGVPVLSVTHDVEEALLLDADVVRMEAGRITGRGTARLVLAEECARMRRVLGFEA